MLYENSANGLTEKTRKSLAFPKRHQLKSKSTHLMPTVRLANRQNDIKLSLPVVRKLVHAVLKLHKTNCHEVSIYFVTERRICDMHRQFFNDPTLTDCISFPIDQELLGEVFVCPKAALQYCTSHDQDPHREVALYIIHGILHLLGYDDLEPSQRRIMRKKERKCMEECKTIIDLLRPE
jgi:probable rRNA maturation factor